MTVASYRLCSVAKPTLQLQLVQSGGAAAILNKPKPITPPITHVTYANLSRTS